MNQNVIDVIVRTLLIIHVASGVVALITALIAASNRKGSKRHRQVGTVFFIAMVSIGVTAIPVTFFRPNPFLFFVALFSFYMAFAGYRRGRKTFAPRAVDLVAGIAMVVVAVAMIGYGFTMVFGGQGVGWALISFGGIGLTFGVNDVIDTRRSRTHAQRVEVHLSRMLGGTIATITAVLVQQVAPHVSEDWAKVAIWLGPTILITPLIVVWQVRIQITGRYRLLPPPKKTP